MLALQNDSSEFCEAIYGLDCHPELDHVVQAGSSVMNDSNWAQVRQCIGRIGMWYRKAANLTTFSFTFPHILNEATCQHLKVPEATRLPEADARTHLSGALKRILPADQKHRVTELYDVLTQLRGFDMEGSFLGSFQERKLNLRVHAEVFLAEYFCSNKIEFLEGDRHVGCSKASCYCCSLYLRHHPDNLVVRPSHGNVWRK